MDLVTFVTKTNLIRLFSKNDFFNFGLLSVEEIIQQSKDVPFYKLFLDNRMVFLKNLIFYTNIAKGMKIDDTNFLLNYKKSSFPAFTPADASAFKFDIEHTFILYR